MSLLLSSTETATGLTFTSEEAAAAAAVDAEIPGSAEILPAAKVEVQPKPTFQAQPVYPAAFRSAGVEGTALIEFVVDADGKVRDATAVSFTHQEFAASAVEAVSKWEFSPGQKAGLAVNTRLKMPFVFTYRKGNSAPKMGDWF